MCSQKLGARRIEGDLIRNKDEIDEKQIQNWQKQPQIYGKY